MDIEELDKHIAAHIQGGFGQSDMAVLKKEIEKLKPGEIYVEIGVDEGRSARVSHEYGHPDVYKIWIDIHDPTHTPNLNRAEWMEQEGMVGIGKKGFYIHGDADEFSDLFVPREKISLMFIDGHHGKEDVEKNTNKWWWKVKRGGVILYHDIDHPGVLAHLNDYYKEWEDTNGKIGKVIIE